MGKFINPFTDFGFKLIFGQELTKDLLIDFLNDLLEGERVIVDIIFLNNEQLPTIAEERAAIYDVYCRTDNGEYIIVEMQYRWHPHFKDRALYYTSRAIQGQGVKGIGWDFELAPVYGIFFMNFADEFTKLRTDAIVTDRDTGELLTNKLRLTYLSMPFFTKTEEECDTNFERWIYVLKN
ncbi:MAG: Rpn family recombination-promoting nuclease/putative transposase, partial [Prevotellaceae bacterium]|nr:Rpn family recombination-promoting nuclease/putative transposase [Prevotellaceae bacterium]